MAYKYKLLEWLVILIATIIISYSLSIETVKAEDKVWKLETEITRLAKQYAVSESKAKKIIACESGNKANAMMINKVNSIDFGFWQINNFYWHDELEELGFDIEIPEQNLEAGFYLMSKYGDKLWYLSSKCWNNNLAKK